MFRTCAAVCALLFIELSAFCVIISLQNVISIVIGWAFAVIFLLFSAVFLLVVKKRRVTILSQLNNSVIIFFSMAFGIALSLIILKLYIVKRDNYEPDVEVTPHLRMLLEHHKKDATLIPLKYRSFSIDIKPHFKPKGNMRFEDVTKEDITKASVLINDILYFFPCTLMYERFVILRPDNIAFKRHIKSQKDTFLIEGWNTHKQHTIQTYQKLDQIIYEYRNK
ncbi:glutamyl-tRNA(Gln) amidotransferase subunit A [Acrasis kona]|uniref:Glutamyl-tRNA(Gln) amidotransferase subunit A n=1 Tax=Acrasis kona TaxID=1008807 RepID=A0AAW2YLD3_9EUKA